jgi:hypothetical protein
MSVVIEGLDELKRSFSEIQSRLNDREGMLGVIRKGYQKRADPRYDQINQTPFAPASLAMGRIPGEFAELTGFLRQQTVNDFEIQGFTILLGPTVPYAEKQDAILRRKGPFAPDAGLIPYTPSDLDQDTEALADWILP